jgi:hypothetical protein
MFSEKDKDEIRLVVVDALKREMKSIEIDVSEADVMKHAGPAIEAKKAELDVKFTEARGDLIKTVDTRLGECIASLGEQVVLAMHQFDEMLQGHFEKIEALISGVEPEKKPAVAAAVRKIAPVASSKGSPALKFLETYVSPGCAYKPTMLLGGQGSGKTTAAKQFAYGAGFGKVVVLYGSRAIEAAALIGRVLPLEGGGTVWQDGKVALAFRYASQGIPTALLIDEYYRILPGDRSPLIPALSAFADPTDGVEYYELTTDRVTSVKDGLALEEEVIRAPRHMLTILATSNIGAALRRTHRRPGGSVPLVDL